ncbi:hypothetical protein CRYUN_Cryun34aG0039700 [Craigia yunnanensis]
MHESTIDLSYDYTTPGGPSWTTLEEGLLISSSTSYKFDFQAKHFQQSLDLLTVIQIPESPNFEVRFTLNVIKGEGPSSQFLPNRHRELLEEQWPQCDGSTTSDVTRYCEMIINPNITAWCNANSLNMCPPYHTFPNGTRVHCSETTNFPYAAYHLYCAPGNAEQLEVPYSLCDPYSNPQPQEILQILPHPVWGEYGYPTKQGEGCIGDPRIWELDVGRLSQSLYFYQDPGTPLARRKWMSVDLGTELFNDPDQVAEWNVSDFDILVPKQ